MQGFRHHSSEKIFFSKGEGTRYQLPERTKGDPFVMPKGQVAVGTNNPAFRFNPLEEDETFSNDELDDLTEGVAVVRFSVSIKLGLEVDGLSLLSSNPLVGMFGLAKDYDKVLREGPWFIGDQFLSIRAWEPYFKPSFTKCSSVAVWVRFPELPIDFFEQMALKEIGQAIGPLLRIDTHTASESVGHKREACPSLVHEEVHVDSPEMDISTPSPPSPTCRDGRRISS
nr:hypothetical protein CFP56_66429 [Quercus suber]